MYLLTSGQAICRHGRAKSAKRVFAQMSRPSTSFFLDTLKDVDARHNGLVLGPAKPDPSAGHDELGLNRVQIAGGYRLQTFSLAIS
jgi:hypothetical protein